MNIILKMKFGSHLYGTDTPESDTDYKGIYLPTAKEIVLSNYKRTVNISRNKEEKERNTKDDVDQEYFSLDRFLGLLTEGQTVALDMLFGYEVGPGTDILDTIWLNKNKLLSKNVNAFIGYARQQAAKYGIKGSRMDALKNTMAFLDSLLEDKRLMDYYYSVTKFEAQNRELISLEKAPLIEIIDIPGPSGKSEPHLHVCGRKIPFHAKVSYAKQVFGRILQEYGARAHKAHLAGGVDWKALSHAVRVNNEAIELLEHGNITFPRPEAEFLKQIKLGQLPYEEVAQTIEEGLAALIKAQENSTLQEKPDLEWAENYIAEVYTSIVKNS